MIELYIQKLARIIRNLIHPEVASTKVFLYMDKNGQPRTVKVKDGEIL